MLNLNACIRVIEVSKNFSGNKWNVLLGDQSFYKMQHMPFIMKRVQVIGFTNQETIHISEIGWGTQD